MILSKLQVLAVFWAPQCSKICLKYRQASFVLVVAFALASCGRVVNTKKNMENFNRDVNFLLMENQCSSKGATDSKVSSDIKELYLRAKQNSPQSFYFINPRFYNYENPMILSIASMEKTLQTLKGDPLQGKNAEELFYLFNESRRFEDQKCSFDSLVQKKKYDIRPYLNITHNCYKKYQSETCDETEFQGMTPEKENWTRENTIELCKSFSKAVNCQAEYSINQKNNSIARMINRYSERFKKEHFEALFKLRPVHQNYKCQKISDNGEDKTVMTIKVLDSSFDHDWLVELLSYVEATWSRKNFSLKLELVKKYDEGVVTIIPTSKGISYVPDDNNRLVYLSTMNEGATMKQVLAHEFGHVLGFPDCYIEFFDDSKKELVYYEMSQKNTNIMCSLKSNVHVPDDYIIQLTQNSCLFN